MLEQNYRVKREVCSSCRHFQYQRQPPDWALKLYPDDPARLKASAVDVGLRCGLGGFPVKRTGTCNKWSRLNATKDHSGST
jgi:hypothetical protein